MTNNETIDTIPDLIDSQISAATRLEFSVYSLDGGGSLGWDNRANYSTNSTMKSPIFVFDGKVGATYDISSSIGWDEPAASVILYDNNGDAVAKSTEQSIGSDYIWNFVAPYAGDYYIRSTWDSPTNIDNISVYEDVDTIPVDPLPPVITDPVDQPVIDPVSDIDRIYNWGESIYTDLFPEHQESQDDVFGYYARLYPNGDALGEKDGGIYYYDGGAGGSGEVVLVGGISDFLPQAIAAGF